MRPHAVSSVTPTGVAPGTPGYGFTYTGNGSTNTRPGGKSYTYDVEGRLATEVTTSGTTSYVYDASGNRLIETSPTGSTLYLGDSQYHVATGSSTLSVVRTYNYLGFPVAERSTQPGVSGSTLVWLIPNSQSTVEAEINPATAAVTRRHVDPFGSPRDGSAVTWSSPNLFLNAPTNTDTGLTHLGARDYDPTLGRFTTVDPLLDPANPSQNDGYSYGWNNPVNAADPAGTRPACADEGNCDGGPSRDVGNVGCGVYCGGAPPPGAPGSAISPGSALTYSNPGGYVSQRTRQKYGCDYVAGTCLGFIATQRATNEIGAYADSAYKDWAEAWRDYDPVAFAEYEAGPCGGSTTCKILAIFGLLIGVYATAKTPDASAVATVGEGRLAAAARGNRAAAACGGGSFSPDTQVVMADGSTRRLDQVKVGDKVEATDTATGTITVQTVTAVWVNHDTDLMNVTIRAGGRTSVIQATQHHLFWDTTRASWVEATHLTAGDQLRTDDGSVATIVSTVVVTGAADMWDLTVTNDHDFYVVTTANILVHNNNCGGRQVDAFLDGTGKVHGNLPLVADLSQYNREELEILRGQLSTSVQTRIAKTVQLGADYGHNARLAQEQALLQSLNSFLDR